MVLCTVPAIHRPVCADRCLTLQMFSAGIGIGLFFFGVAEPIQHYESCYADPFAGPGSECFGNRYSQLPDNDRSQWAMNLTYFHWGLHAWTCYSIVGICLGVMVYRKCALPAGSSRVALAAPQASFHTAMHMRLVLPMHGTGVSWPTRTTACRHKRLAPSRPL